MSETKEALFSKEQKLISDPLSDNNPVTIQEGICSALAITVQLKAAFVMAILPV